jgi:HSP20 family protein
MTKDSEKEKKGLRRSTASGMTPFEEMERWFDDFSPRRWLRSGWDFPSFPRFDAPFEDRHPRVDVIDRETEVVVKAELPGVKKEDLDVSLSDNKLVIKATTSQEKEEEEGAYFRRETSRGEFQRTLLLPENIDDENVQATFKDGLLELKMPKLAATKHRSITVE